ncbi:hypothetical protein [Paenibacillus pinihumi]|uniref:hypothetical protein n=1 Tax=Paenibacillus pinihumi TaxID=669462 RepID=UPI000402CC9E|nr:hypothetical protein [Paenibacillus pinihumi]
MFLKKQTVVRNGKIYHYYRVVAAYTDEHGRRKHRLVKHIGVLTVEEAERMRLELREQSNEKEHFPGCSFSDSVWCTI